MNIDFCCAVTSQPLGTSRAGMTSAERRDRLRKTLTRIFHELSEPIFKASELKM